MNITDTGDTPMCQQRWMTGAPPSWWCETRKPGAINAAAAKRPVPHEQLCLLCAKLDQKPAQQVESIRRQSRRRTGESDVTLMIIDCYTHTWESSDQLGRESEPDHLRRSGADPLSGHPAGATRHLTAAEPVDRTFVLGFKSSYLGAELPNDQVAAYVRKHPNKLIGFAGVDPSDPKLAIEEVRRARQELNMPGAAIAPAAQDFHPTSSQAMRIYAEVSELAMPLIFHAGVCVSTATKLEYAQPVLIDEIARELPALKIIIAHLGYPWANQTFALLAKHPNVFSEISYLLGQPWQAYQALLTAYECGVIDKLLFGSGFPHLSASHCIEALYSINHLVQGTNLPTIPRENLRGIVERDTLTILGISHGQPIHDASPSAIPDDAEDF